MSEPTYRPEHEWIPDALGFTRYVVRRAQERGHVLMYDVQDLADVVTRLADALKDFRTVYGESPSETPEEPETTPEGSSQDHGRLILPNIGWFLASDGSHRRTTVDGTHLWVITRQTDYWPDGWWYLTLYRRYRGECPPDGGDVHSIKADDVAGASRKADDFIRLFHMIPSDSAWTLRSHDPVSCVCGSVDASESFWEVVDMPYGYTLRRPLDSPETWALLGDEIPGVLEEADGIIERREVSKRRMAAIRPEPPSGPRIAGEDD
jgi:hypothetical protein